MPAYQFDWEKINSLNDDEYDQWITAVDSILLTRAQEFGITPEDIAHVKTSADNWRRGRAESDLANVKAEKAEAKMEEAGRNLLPALEDHMPDDELPN